MLPDSASWVTELEQTHGEKIHFLANSIELLQSLFSGYEAYQRLDSSPIHDFIESSKALIDAKSKSYPQNHSPVLTKEWYKAYLFSQGEPVRLLKAYAGIRILSVGILTEEFLRSLISGNLLIPLICCRTSLEHIASFNAIISELESLPTNNDITGVQHDLAQKADLLKKRLFARRVDWMELLSDPDKASQRKNIRYSAEEHHVDLTAEQILKDIDALDKIIKGTRSWYEVLCEFAHPNVGVVLAFTQSTNQYADTNGLSWTEHRFSRSPFASLQELRQILDRVLEIYSRCMSHFLLLLQESLPTMLTLTNSQAKATSRELLSVPLKTSEGMIKLKEHVDIYSVCPCGSELKMKFCCASIKA